METVGREEYDSLVKRVKALEEKEQDRTRGDEILSLAFSSQEQATKERRKKDQKSNSLPMALST